MKNSKLTELESEIVYDVEKEAKYYEQIALNLGKKFRIFFNFPYTKLSVFILSIILAYFIFSNPTNEAFISKLDSLNYLGMFIAGILFSFGFTAPFAIGFFLTANPGNIILAAVIGGIGASASDILIFKLIKISLMDDFRRLENLKAFSYIRKKITNHMPSKIKTYSLYALSGIIIASPLPNEVGVGMLAGMTEANAKTMGIVSFAFNTLGILIMLLIELAY